MYSLAHNRVRTLLALTVAGSALAFPAWAQPAGGGGGGGETAATPAADAQNLSDFVHYIRIARYDLAKAFGLSLLDKMPQPIGNAEAGKATMTFAQFASLVDMGNEAGRFSETVLRGARVAELEGTADRLIKAYEQGKLEQARDPEEIRKNIELLTGTQRQRVFARERLAFAGEYAVPQLLTALRDGSKPSQQAEVRQLLGDMGRPAVMPLCMALSKLDATGQEQVISILGGMPYRAAIPFLYEVHAAASSASVKTAAERAIKQIDGQFSADARPGVLMANLAEAYASKNESLLLLPREDQQPVWSYDPQIGLWAMPVKSEIFHDMMAIRLAERALSLDESRADAVATWLQANFSREILTPKDYDNPLWPKDKPDAMYYAVAAGPSAAQAVLARAIDAKNTAIARRAIAAIERTAGAGALASTLDGRSPLLEALRYPSRRVQYEAALALAAGNPASSFAGSERVVPILASAVRDVESRFAAVISPDREAGETVVSQLKAMGYTVLPLAGTAGDLIGSAADVPGVDLVVSLLPGKSTADALKTLRNDTRLAATPVVAILSAESQIEAGAEVMRDPMLRAIRPGLDAAQMTEAVKQFVDLTGSGPLSEEETKAYKLRALGALRDLALSGSTTLSAADAVMPLVSALPGATGEVKMAIADVLVLLSDKRAQVAVVDAATAAQGPEMIGLVDRAAVGAKKFGNLLEDRQVSKLVELAGSLKGAEGTAVAALVGSLNLPNRTIVPLIAPAK